MNSTVKVCRFPLRPTYCETLMSMCGLRVFKPCHQTKLQSSKNCNYAEQQN